MIFLISRFYIQFAKQFNILDAKNEYQDLRRELSRKSQRTSHSKAEEGEADSEDFNLDEFLHGISQKQDEGGHKRKHIGVSWKNLHVEVTT